VVGIRKFVMRFQWTGELDCPDWILAAVGDLSSLSVLKLRSIVLQCSKCLQGQQWDRQKLNSMQETISVDLDNILSSCLYILESSSRFNCKPARLDEELQLIGLPREHSQTFAQIFSESRKGIQSILLEHRFKLPAASIRSWTFEKAAVAAADNQPMTASALLNVELSTKNENNSLKLSIPHPLMQSLIRDLRTAEKILERFVVSQSDSDSTKVS